ncbi:Flp family type IVb pilin [Labrys wisconsinensis]|uniref:Flp pilus assembly pilin Flp n=1 Tax=Labrys wisconsinensis TaxID=425677 RepID=A0ABU0J246_9HYPH|nr:Flp family type IVb pilin [Labrys wisconsinensis]MDQ0467518.1 Flp pilus assembly pilin Flp [Labrys wisconsinensis]
MRTGRTKAAGRMLAAFARDRSGGVAIEYGLVAGLIFLAIVAAVHLLSQNLMDNFWNKVSNAVANSPGS